MGRVPGWETRLYQATRELAARPFEWGKNDCALFCADVVLALTNTDYMARFRGRYSTEIGAARVIRSEGFADLGDAAASMLPEIHVSEAQRGDVALCDGKYGPFLSIITGHMVIGPTCNGLMHVSVTHAMRAFKVG